MVIHNLNLVSVPVTPLETDAPLIVEPDAMLSSPIPNQFLQAIPRRRPQVFQCLRSIQEHQLAEGSALDIAGQLLDSHPVEKALRLVISEGSNHRAYRNASR